MRSLTRHLHIVLLAAVLALLIPRAGYGQGFEEARIYIEYNETANDLGFHVSLDGEDWTDLKIFDPTGKKIFDVSASGAAIENAWEVNTERRTACFARSLATARVTVPRRLREYKSVSILIF